MCLGCSKKSGVTRRGKVSGRSWQASVVAGLPELGSPQHGGRGRCPWTDLLMDSGEQLPRPPSSTVFPVM